MFTDKEGNLRIGRIVTLAVILIIALVLIIPSIKFVDQGEACAVTKAGKVSRTVGPGAHMKFPIVEAWKCFNTRQTVYQTTTETDKDADFNDVPVDANTNDGQQIQVTYSISFHVDEKDVAYVYGRVGKNMTQVMENVVKFYSRSYVRNAMQKYKAAQIYSGDLLVIQQDIEAALKTDFEKNHVTLDAVVLRKPTFAPDYVSSIEQQQIAQQSIQTEEYKAQAATNTAKATVAIAKGAADAAIESARGQAEAIKQVAVAQAYAIEQQGVALNKYPEMLQWHFLDQLDKANWMILPKDGAMPLLQIPEVKTQTE